MSSPPDDRFERYYAEKLWELVPGTHRHEDGIAEQPGVLRALIEIIGARAAVLRRSQDRLWDDEFIDLCEDWAVPYIGDLVDTRLVSALNKRGRRIDVAKTIYYRRRKGTVRVLEELVADITGWEGKVVESFRGLARAKHNLDPAPRLFGLEGRFSGTPAHGFADLRDPRAAALTDGPFDEYAHLPDVRQPRGTDGRWNIPKIAFHLYRLESLEVVGVRPHVRADGVTFTFDPSGRDTPLFIDRRRIDDWDTWTSAEPWELPAPMTCRLLGHAEYVISEALVARLVGAGLSQAAADELHTIANVRMRSERRLRGQLAAMAHAADYLAPGILDLILRDGLIEACGKRQLYPRSVNVAPSGGLPVRRQRMEAANLETWATTSSNDDLLIDPNRGRFKLLSPAPDPDAIVVAYLYGFPGDIGAGTYDRRTTVVVPATRTIAAGGAITAAAIGISGSAAIVDSGSYGPIDDRPGVTALVVEAANEERPYIRLEADWVITAAAAAPEPTLVLDGLWLGASGAFSVVLDGAWDKVTIRHCTLDPGGVDVDGDPIAAVPLVIAGQVRELVIEQSIVATVATRGAGLVHELQVSDSILQASRAGGTAIALGLGMTTLVRVTAFGQIAVERLYASELIVTEHVDVVDTQAGCFRFSAAPEGSRLPHPFRSVELTSSTHLFTSRRFGDPGYAQLSASAPVEIVRGAENGSEMGAWSSLLNPIKEDGLSAKVDEFLPFGLIPSFIKQT
jgi:hypothetical protein